MSNKSQLQTNTTNLDALITRVNTAKNTAASLPNAGSATEDLNTIITELETKVETLNTALNEKASGGTGDVETYDLIVQSDGKVILNMISYIEISTKFSKNKRSRIYSESRFFGCGDRMRILMPHIWLPHLYSS